MEVATATSSLVELPEPVWVTVVTRDRRGPRARCRVLVSEGADEVLSSDSAIDAVGVGVRSFSKGTWSFLGEKRVRRSARRQLWPLARGSGRS